ncbi:ent-kaurene oxidase [Truncatella angustata]|uniref:Ent-kaurene oxidase n=1 Tax=Truncatella angustata TaxID=152316 RepID=A0A9P8UM37_9PEZI|nr:ent-kaurene oxidase [Truncatella angustata]KAH6654487.1 ent-kaurene oxidase [Truncatella angustata]
MDQLTNFLADRAPIFASVAVLLGAAFLFSTFTFQAKGTDKIPLVGKEFGNAEQRRKAFIANAHGFYAKGYEMYKNVTWRLTGTDEERIVLPRHLLDEARRFSDDHINITKAFDKNNEKRYTGLGAAQSHTDFLIHLIRSDLTRGLNRINTRLTVETARTVVEELGPCEDWTSEIVYQKLLRIVAIISGNIFIGPELCRRDEWTISAITYTVDLFTAIGKLKQWKPWTRPIGQYFIPELKSVREHRRKARAFLKPVIAERRKLMKEGKDLPDDMLQWMMNKTAEFGISDDDLSLIQLNLSLAAIHTTTLTTTLALYDLVVRPDLLQELRNEVKTVLAANDGVLSTHALFDMKLLDSVMKESQRTNPGNLVRFVRYVDKPVTLSDGTHLPVGAMIEAPHANIVQDPQLYSNPETFDAHRFMDLRNGTVEDPMEYRSKEQYQFVTVTKDFMAFGYGRHACPGRFFAANEIKLILARILLDYDIKMPDGITERYPNLNMGLDALPDPTKAILFKKFKTSA